MPLVRGRAGAYTSHLFLLPSCLLLCLSQVSKQVQRHWFSFGLIRQWSDVSTLLQDVIVGSQESEEDPTAGLLRGAECNVCMNRPVQVGPALKVA